MGEEAAERVQREAAGGGSGAAQPAPGAGVAGRPALGIPDGCTSPAAAMHVRFSTVRWIAITALLITTVAGCDSRGSDDAPTLLDAMPSEAALVVRSTGAGLAGAAALLPEGVPAGVLALIPQERLAEVIAAADTAGTLTALAVRVTGNASDFTGFLGATGEAHRAATLFTVPGTGVLAVRGDLMIVAATADGVRASLDRIAGAAPRLSDDAVARRLYRRTLASPLGIVSGQTAQIADLAGDLLGGAGGVLALVPLSRIALGLQVQGTGSAATATGTLWLAPATGTSAEGLNAVLRLAVGALGQQPGLDPATRALLATLAFTADGGDVATPISIPLSALGGIGGTAP